MLISDLYEGVCDFFSWQKYFCEKWIFEVFIIIQKSFINILIILSFYFDNQKFISFDFSPLIIDYR